MISYSEHQSTALRFAPATVARTYPTQSWFSTGLHIQHRSRRTWTRKQRRKTLLLSAIPVFLAILATMLLATALTQQVTLVQAESFTDIFYTNSFRGAFVWFKKLDWVGMLVQCVISTFSLFGVALITIRIMTSMLYLSAKGIWQEVHDLKSGGGESEFYDFGMINMVKGWAKGKAGTGLDAIFGAVLIMLPDVREYSDFGDKAGGKFDEDITIGQYMLKIAMPTVMSVFFFAMGFNGTLFQALAVTVDAMGAVADKAVSVNYAGFVDDIINSGTGYKFAFSSAGTERGGFQQSLAKDLYGRVISQVRDANPAQLHDIGVKVEEKVDKLSVKNSKQISEKVLKGLDSDVGDKYWGYLGSEIIVNTSAKANGEVAVFSTDDLIPSEGISKGEKTYYHIFVKQTKDFDGAFFNTDSIVKGKG